MTRLATGLLGLGFVCVLAAACGSSDPPEAYPGRPIDPPNGKDELLEMLTGGTGAPVAAEASAVIAEPTVTPTTTTTAPPPFDSATVRLSGSARASARPSARPTAKPSAAPSVAPTAKPKTK